MARQDFIDAKSIVDELEKSFRNVEKAVVDNAETLKRLQSEYNKLPSGFIAAQKTLLDLTIKQSKAEEQLLKTKERAEKVSQQEINTTQKELRLQQQREAILNKNANAASKLTSEYQRLNAQKNQAARLLQDLIVRGQKAGQTQKQFNREVKEAQNEFNRLNTRVVQANRAVGRFYDNVGNYPKQAILGLRDLVGAFGIVGGVSAFAAITKDIFQTTKELQSLDLALKQVINDNEVLADTQQFLARISEAYGIEIQGLTRSFTQFYVSAKDKLSGQEIRGIFESISKAAGAMGLSVEQQEGTFTALTQMLSKGTVQAEELRGQLSERLPGSFGILAKSMGVTEQQLGKMLEQGQVLASEVLPKFAKELEKAYNIENIERVETLNAETARLSNEWTNFIRILNEGDSSVTSFFGSLISGAAGALKGLGLLLGGFRAVEEEVSKDIENNVLQQNIQYYKDLGEEQGKLQAAYDAPIYKERLKDLKEENVLLNEAIALTEAAIDETSFFSLGGTQERQRLTGILAEQKKALQENMGAIAMNEGAYMAATQTLDLFNKEISKNTELTDKQRKELEKKAEEELKNQYRLRRLILESEREGFKERMDNTNLYYSDREDAAKDITIKEIELAELSRKEGLRLAKNNKTQQLIVWEEYYKEFEDIVKNDEERILKLRKDSYEEYQEYTEKFQGEGLRGQSTEDLVSLWEDKEKKEKEAADKAKEQLKKDIDDYLRTFTEGFFDDIGMPTLFKVLNDEIAGFGENWAVTFTAMAEIAQEVMAFMGQASQQAFQAEYENLERRYEIAQRFAGEGEAAQEEVRRQYEERRRDIRRRELEAQKEQAIFNATVNVAQGITAALATANIPLSILIGALGAAQIAFIASQQIPAYYQGTDNHIGGKMLVNDGGGANYREMIVEPNKAPYIPIGRNKVINAPKGTKVFTAHETKEIQSLNKILTGNDIAPISDTLTRDTMSHISVLGMGQGMTKQEMYEAVKQAVGEMTVIRQHWDKNGMNEWYENQGNKTTLTNNRVSFKGISL